MELALTPGEARFVTLAKYAISFCSPVQGSVLARPMPILLVAATIKVSSRAAIMDSFSRVSVRNSTEFDMALVREWSCVVVEENM